jgi:hypothetical protein
MTSEASALLVERMTQLRRLSNPVNQYATAAHPGSVGGNFAARHRFSDERRVASDVAQRYAGIASMLRLLPSAISEMPGCPDENNVQSRGSRISRHH